MGKLLPENYSDLFLEFQKKILISRTNLKLNEKNLDRIINVNETPIYMDMPQNKTVDYKGAKDIGIITFGGEKAGISVLLGITLNGKKLRPLLIFKAKPFRTLEKKLNQIVIVKAGKVFVFCQEKARCVIEIFIKWLKLIFLNYQNNEAKDTCLLVLDKAPSHVNKKVIQFLNDNNIKRIFIPGGLTSKLQPLDVVVNKPFKDYLKEKYNQYQIDNDFNIISNNHQAKLVDR